MKHESIAISDAYKLLLSITQDIDKHSQKIIDFENEVNSADDRLKDDLRNCLSFSESALKALNHSNGDLLATSIVNLSVCVHGISTEFDNLACDIDHVLRYPLGEKYFRQAE